LTYARHRLQQTEGVLEERQLHAPQDFGVQLLDLLFQTGQVAQTTANNEP
jgi:hypothetical protein